MPVQNAKNLTIGPVIDPMNVVLPAGYDDPSSDKFTSIGSFQGDDRSEGLWGVDLPIMNLDCLCWDDLIVSTITMCSLRPCYCDNSTKRLKNLYCKLG